MFSKTAQRGTTFGRSGGSCTFLHQSKHPFEKRDVQSPGPVSVSDSTGIRFSLGLGRRACHLSHGEKRAQSYITNTGIPMLLMFSLPSPAFSGGWEM